MIGDRIILTPCFKSGSLYNDGCKSMVAMILSFCEFYRTTVPHPISSSSSASSNLLQCPDFRWISYFLLLLVSTLATGDAHPSEAVTRRQQFFRINPSDTEAIQGDTIKLVCQVANQAGAVQWSKDGSLLGYRSAIPGMLRFTMLIDAPNGVYNLRISNVRLEDEGEYQCQVGPSENQPPIRASSKLSVIVPPSQLTISGSGSNGNTFSSASASTSSSSSHQFSTSSSSSSSSSPNHKIEVMAGERVTLVCSSSASKPPPRVKWFRKSTELLPEASRTYYNKSIVSSRYILYTMESSIILYPKAEEHYSCEIHHTGLRKPLRASSIINILSEPGIPVIEGYKDGQTVISGQKVDLNCVSRGGYPPPKVHWSRNGIQVDTSFSVNAYNEAVNSYSFIASVEDNQSVYKCSVSNGLTSKSLQVSIKLNVIFLPTKVTISGPTEARLYQTIVLNCITRPGNPVPRIFWMVEDSMAQPTTLDTQQDGHNKWIVKSTLSFAVTSRYPSVRTFTCKTQGFPTGESVMDKHRVSVIYAPEPPIFTGYSENSSIISGSVQRFKCISLGGNPAPEIKWLKENREITSTTSSLVSNGVSSELVIRPESSDNGAEYKCQVTSPALSTPYVTSKKLNVIYPPQNVQLKVSPQHLKENGMATFECKVGPANPAAQIEWRINGRTEDETRSQVQPSKLENGRQNGFSTRSWLQMSKLTPQHDKAVVSCVARSNQTMDSTLRKDIVINVLYKPEFRENGFNITMIEGESKMFNISVRANPRPDRYEWKRVVNGQRDPPQTMVSNFFKIDTSILYLSNISRNESGQYILAAFNQLGSHETLLHIDVQYSAHISGPILVKNALGSMKNAPKEGDPFVQLHCPILANPLPTVKWLREDEGSAMDWFRVKYELSVSGHQYMAILIIFNITREDAGLYSCAAHNSINVRSSTSSVRVRVEYPPVILKSVENKVAGDLDLASGRLWCLANGYPSVEFEWSGQERDTSKYKVVNVVNTTGKQEGFQLYRSDLIISKLTNSDFGVYRCRAYNYLGDDTMEINFVPKGTPDPPSNLAIVNVTHDAVTIRWEPGFDGGSEQSFRISYKPIAARKSTSDSDLNDEDAEGLFPHQIHPRDESVNRHESNRSVEENLVHTFVPTGLRVATICNLESAMEYLITVASRNQFGESRITSESVKARTNPVPIGILSRSNPASASASDDNRFESAKSGLLGINLSIILVGGILALVSLLLFSGLLFYMRCKPSLMVESYSDSRTSSNSTATGSSLSQSHPQTDQLMRTAATSGESGLNCEPPPYMINIDSVAPLCKCEPLPMLTMSISKHDQLINCDTKCFLQGDKLINFYQNEIQPQVRVHRSSDPFQYHQHYQPDILISRSKDDMMNDAVCCENGLQLMERMEMADSNSLSNRRIPRVNIIDGEYTLTTVPEEECEEIL